MMNPPLISIVTPCLNRAAFLREAVESVLAQDYPCLEHLVMDGGSTDGSLELLRSYPHLRVISEPDRGMYHAINKGLRIARGDIIGLLNTDDRLPPGALVAVASAFSDRPDCLAVVGGASFNQKGESGWQLTSTAPAIEAQEFWQRVIQGNPVSNAWYYRRQVFERLGYLDERFRYVSDRYFLVRIALDGGVRPEPVRQVLYEYLQHADSVTLSARDSRLPRFGQIRNIVLGEGIQANEEFLARRDLPGEARFWMRRAHSELCYRLAATALYHHQWRTGLRACWRGWSRDIGWPWIALRMTSQRLGREITRHG